MISARCAVVGAGLAGAAAAWRLAASGVDTVLLEARTPAHDGGSSHGSARIFRHAYGDPEQVALTVRALAGWRELEAASGTPLLRVTGGLDARRDLPAIAAALTLAGVEHELLPAAAAAARWPHLAFGSDVLYQPGAGVVDVASAVAAMVGLAERDGARVRLGWRLAGVERRDGGRPGWRLTPSGDGETVEAELLVLCAGPWLPELAGAAELAPVRAMLPELRVTEQSVFHFPFPEDDDGDGWPTWVHKDELNVYALPGGRDAGHRGFKIAEHDRGRPVTASIRDGAVDPASRERIVDYVRRRLPGVRPTPYATTTCLYTWTPDEEFVLDRVGDAVVVSACSGHGAKFAPLLGELTADLVHGRPVPSRFRASTQPGG